MRREKATIVKMKRREHGRKKEKGSNKIIISTKRSCLVSGLHLASESTQSSQINYENDTLKCQVMLLQMHHIQKILQNRIFLFIIIVPQ